MMGGTCPQHASNDKCNCFMNDNKIKNVDIIRYSSSKWIWSTYHEMALIDSLSDFYYVIPKEIMYLIKDHSFHHTQDFYVLRPVICREKYYSKQHELIRKNLCHRWYSQQTDFITQPLLIGLHVSHDQNSQQIFNSLSAKSLPALELRNTLFINQYDQIRRTIYIDQCQIGLHLISVNNNNQQINDKNKILSYPAIHMILLNESDSINTANICCTKIWNEKQSMKNVIIVRVHNNNNNNNNNIISQQTAIKEVAKYWNIPIISVNFNVQQTITDLFVYAVKYYWFCSVVQ